MKRLTKVFFGVLLSASMLMASGCQKGVEDVEEVVNSDFIVSYDGIKVGSVGSTASVHDPSIIQVGDKYYIFGSHMTAAVSDNLRNFVYLASNYGANNPIYGGLYDSNLPVFEYAGSKNSIISTDDGGVHVWAPDVIYNEKMGKYVMYCCTTSTWNASNLYYATCDTIDGKYEWQGALIYSGFNSSTLQYTDVLDYVDEEYALDTYVTAGDSYNYKDYPNAIDPSVFYDADGRMWMVYGSWSGGIYLLEIDESTGKVIHPKADPDNKVDPYFGKRLIGGGHTSIEGPYILYDEASGYYYLFVSYGALTSNGGYQIRVFRSDKPDGDYVDMNGKAPSRSNGNHAYFGLKLSGNYMLPSLRRAYMATGHNSAFIDENDGKGYIVYHTRFDDGGEMHSPRVHQFFVNEEGWPCMSPYQTNGETVSETGYDVEKVIGEYYMINQGMDISSDIAEPVMIELTNAGNVYDKTGKIGTYKVTKDTAYIHITINEVEYSGVLCEMTDEGTNPVMTFTAVGDNMSIWGVKY